MDDFDFSHDGIKHLNMIKFLKRIYLGCDIMADFEEVVNTRRSIREYDSKRS